MKIRIEPADGEDEIIIRCKDLTDEVKRIYQTLLEASSGMPPFAFYKDSKECYFPVDDILFFQTEGSVVYAHTADDLFSVKLKLYELLDILPRSFIRVSKSALLNTGKVYSIERNLTSASKVGFLGSHKQIYVSRMYFKDLRQAMDKRLLKPEERI